MTCEDIAEHGFVDNRLGAGVEGCRYILNGLFPPRWNESPPHWHKAIGVVAGRLHDVDGVGWRDVVVGLQVAGSAHQAIQVLNFAPSVALRESSAHSITIICHTRKWAQVHAASRAARASTAFLWYEPYRYHPSASS